MVNLVFDMPKVTLFLGAGASRAFDYPTTEEFMTNLGLKISGGEKEILDAFRRTPEIKDIEHILQTLDILISADSNPYLHANFKQFPPMMPTKAGTRNWVQYIAWCKSLKERIRTSLHTQYEFDPNKLNKVLGSYGALLNRLAIFNGNRQLDIFTTNYDRVIEEFAMNDKSQTVDLIDGFSFDSRQRGRFWNRDEFDRKQTPSATLRLRLFKLHGSLNWRETHDGRIESVRTEERCSGTRRYTRSILIYPTQKGLEGEDPFATLLGHFREAALHSKTFLVIGFSFRDPIIDDIFLNHLRESHENKLIVVSPSAKENVKEYLVVRARNRTERKTFETQVQSLKAKFGEDKTIKQIEDALKMQKKRPN